MEDLSAKLSSLLENPAELEQLKNLAGSLLGGNMGGNMGGDMGNGTGGDMGASGGGQAPAPVDQTPASASSFDPSALLSSLLQSAGPSAPPAPVPAPAPSPASSPMDSLFSSIGPKELQAIMKIGSALKAPKQDDRSQLLMALRPHLSPARQERVDQAVKILRILDTIPLLKDSGLDLFGNLL